jgi:hypothetical protein
MLPAIMEKSMNTNGYVPPKVWTHLKPNGGVFESINLLMHANAKKYRDLARQG